MSKTELEAAFLNTNYTVLKNDIFREEIILKIGEKNDLSFALPSLIEWAFITAWNPLPEVLSNEQNKLRNTAFITELNTFGFVSHLGLGFSDDGKWFEESFFIENISKEKAMAYAKKYGQLAFIHGINNQKAELIFTK